MPPEWPRERIMVKRAAAVALDGSIARKVQGNCRGKKFRVLENARNSLSRNGALAATRTRNLLIRSQMLYPIELRVLSDPEIGRRDAIIVCPGWQQLRAEKSGRWACGDRLPQGGGPRLATAFFLDARFFFGEVDTSEPLHYQRRPASTGQPHFPMATTEIILTEKIEHLGAEADIVKVKRGYARNFLVPQGKALEVTAGSLKRINNLKAKRAEREGREMNEAEELARRINKLKITVELETGGTGKAFGSVTAADLAERLKKELGGTLEIDRHRIHLERPIKETGEHEVSIKLHHDVTAKLTVTVKAKGSEAAPEAKAEEAEEKGFKARPKAKHSK